MASTLSHAQTAAQPTEQQISPSKIMAQTQPKLPVPAKQETTWQAASIAQAQQTLLASKLTGRTYRIQVMAVGDAPATGYVPVYVLDGDMMFPTAASAAYTYYNHAKDNGAQPLLIVGIGYDNGKLLDIPMRSLDYTVTGVGDSYNDISMLKAAHHGILYRPPDNVRTEFPGFPVADGFPALRRLFETILADGG